MSSIATTKVKLAIIIVASVILYLTGLYVMYIIPPLEEQAGRIFAYIVGFIVAWIIFFWGDIIIRWINR